MSCCIEPTLDTEALEPLLRWVAPSVPTCPRDMALDYLRQAWIEFAKKTSLVTVTVTLPIQKGVKNYALVPPKGYQVYGMKDVSFMEFPYQRFADAHSWYYAWGYRFRLEGNKEIVFQDDPSQDDNNRKIVLRLIPIDCVEDIPTEIATAFGKGIAMGALADILEIPNKSWTNFPLAQKKRRDFDRTVLAGRQLEITNRGAKTPMLRPTRIL